MKPLDARGLHGKQPVGQKHYRWNQRLFSSHGYPKIRVGIRHPLADPNGYAYEHLLVWVSAGNPRPGSGEVLRTKNGDKSDCRVENLHVVTRGEHSRLANADRVRDTQGRLMSKMASRLVRAGATVRTVRLKR